MIMRTKREIREYLWLISYFICYILWAVYYRICPLFGDMFVMKTDYLVRNSTLIGVMKAILKTGGCWRNARYLVNFINIYMVSYEWIGDFIIPLAFVFAIFFSLRTVNGSNKWWAAVAGMGLFFCISDGVVGQCYAYSYVLFLFPIALLPIFAYVIKQYYAKRSLFDTRIKQIAFILLVYGNACFLESVSCVFSVLMAGIFIEDYFVKKEKNRTIMIGAIVSLVQTLYMNLYLIIRGTRPLTEEGSSYLYTVTRNFRVLILEAWLANPIIIIAFLLMLIVAVRKNKIFLIVDTILLAGYSVWEYLVYTSHSFDTASFELQRNDVISYVPENLWPLWMVMYIAINLFVLYQVWTVNRYIALVFFVGGGSTAPVLLTPNTGWRISSFYVFMIIISTIMMMQNEEEKKSGKIVASVAAIAVFALGMTIFAPRIIRTYNTQKILFEKVEEAKKLQENGQWNIEKDTLILPCYDRRDIMGEGQVDYNSYYEWNFACAYGLNKDTNIETR